MLVSFYLQMYRWRAVRRCKGCGLPYMEPRRRWSLSIHDMSDEECKENYTDNHDGKSCK